MNKTVKLTSRTAFELISRICTGLDIIKDDTAPHVAIFRATTGSDGLWITCENDWYDHNGRIKLTIHDALNGSCIIRYYRPYKLTRDYDLECAEKEAEREEMRREWAQSELRTRRNEAMNEEKKNLPVEGNDIPSELMRDIKKRNAARRAAAETTIAEPVECSYMDYARAGWRVAYIMTAFAACLTGLCAWLVGVLV